MYLAWFDADRKKPVDQKIAEARERYRAKFGHEPAVCLVNPADAVEGGTIEVRPLQHIGRHCFWIGFDDLDDRREEPADADTPSLPAADATAPAVAEPVAGGAAIGGRRRKPVGTPQGGTGAVETAVPAGERVGAKGLPPSMPAATPARKGRKRHTDEPATAPAPAAARPLVVDGTRPPAEQRLRRVRTAA